MRLLVSYITGKITKAHALICTAVELKIGLLKTGLFLISQSQWANFPSYVKQKTKKNRKTAVGKSNVFYHLKKERGENLIKLCFKEAP